MEKQQPAVIVKKLHKSFRLPHEKHSGLKSLLLNISKRNKSFEVQQVLKGLSFTINKGEFFGIVGRNGSGKSTLLKMLAEIYPPTSGDITINGKLTPFIELGVGFNPELTGRENVFLNGALLGFNRKEMALMYDDIVAFAELERFMDQKLKNYSSGMQVRLAFSIAIRAKSEILLIDEVLAVGDAAFQQKCYDVFSELKKAGVTIILVTHDMNAVLRFCDRAMLIEKGEIISQGKPTVVADDYLELNYDKTEEERVDNKNQNIPHITSLEINGTKAKEHKFKQDEKINVVLHYANKDKIPLHFGFQIFNDEGVYCFGTNTANDGVQPITKQKGSITITVTTTLAPGNYYVNAATMNENTTTVLDYKAKAARFRMIKDTQLQGVVILDHSWSETKNTERYV